MDDKFKLIMSVFVVVVLALLAWHFKDTDFSWVQQYIDAIKEKLNEAYAYLEKLYAQIKNWYDYILEVIKRIFG